MARLFPCRLESSGSIPVGILPVGSRYVVGCRMSLGVLACLLPVSALASDYSGFFVLFMEIPLLAASLLFLAICFVAPKLGMTLVALLLVGSLVILGWAVDVGYMSTGGEMLMLSLLVDLVAIGVAVRKKRPAGGSGDAGRD